MVTAGPVDHAPRTARWYWAVAWRQAPRHRPKAGRVRNRSLSGSDCKQNEIARPSQARPGLRLRPLTGRPDYAATDRAVSALSSGPTGIVGENDIVPSPTGISIMEAIKRSLRSAQPLVATRVCVMLPYTWDLRTAILRGRDRPGYVPSGTLPGLSAFLRAMMLTKSCGSSLSFSM